MKLSEVPYGWIVTLTVEHINQEKFPTNLSLGKEVKLQFCAITQQNLLKIQDQIFPISGLHAQDKNLLNELHTQGLPYLVWLLGGQPNNHPTQLFLQVHRFSSQIYWSKPIKIGLGENVISDIQKKYVQSKNIELIQTWLKQQLFIENPFNKTISRLFIGTYDGKTNSHSATPTVCLYGLSILAEVLLELETEQLKIIKIYSNRNNVNQNSAVVLTEGNIQIINLGPQDILPAESKQQWLSLLEKDSYLNLWLRYNKLEHETLWKRARNFGYFAYQSWSIQDGRYHFHLKTNSPMLEKVQELAWEEELELEAREKIPYELLHPGWENSTKNTLNESPPFIGKLVSFFLESHPDELVLEPLREDDQDMPLPPNTGYLCYSMFGDQKRLERRLCAEMAIRTGRCPMPQLRLLLQGRITPSIGWRGISPNSYQIFHKFPGLNHSQQEAIRIALNTPDIALIQGPPGTGKTTVITALITRLSELETQHLAGQVLCTSFQHEAVTNVAERIEIYGIPAIKIGARYGDNNEIRQRTLAWVKDQVAKLEPLLEHLPIPIEYQGVRDLIQNYILHPDSDEIIEVLKKLYDLTPNLLPSLLRDEIKEMCDKLQYGIKLSDDSFEIMDKIWIAYKELRTDAKSFVKDGAIKAGKLLRRLAPLEILSCEEKKLLETASNWVTNQPLNFLVELTQLQEQIQQRLLIYQNRQSNTINPEILKMLTQVLDAMIEYLRCSEYGRAVVLQNYLHELQNHPDGVRTALLAYTSVFAATCQQAASRQIAMLKNNQIVYDSVIVDEAARANPLDLFIPLAQAQQRIILVGDHRQLPQMLEPSLEYDSELKIPQQLQEQWKTSLFERLFIMMKEREQQDGIRRTITLDTQYRMHPILGEFVSQQFYEVHGDACLQSGLDTEQVAHHLPQYYDKKTGQEKVAVWLEVTLQQGAEQKGQSKSRHVEAQRIAKKLQELMTTNPNLSFGVISFYAAQVTDIQNELCRLQIMTRKQNNDFEVSPNYRYLTNTSSKTTERLRVGTVDAFQGREFDVVFLSMTRSNNYPFATQEDLRRKYGHLMLSNRLCVAMSRQKRLLIVAGDSEMLHNTAAAEVICPLVEFYKLCEGPYGYIE